MRRLFVLLVPSLLLQADQFDSVRNSIRTQLVDTQAPSIAVAVAKDGRIIWEQGFGWADRERRIAADEPHALLVGFDLEAFHCDRTDDAGRVRKAGS
jgi:CubicO group peptidase (beta-lactamase class C family)